VSPRSQCDVCDLLTAAVILLHVSEPSSARAFSFSGQSAWNALPTDTRDKACTTTFKKKLKTFYFSQAIIEYGKNSKAKSLTLMMLFTERQNRKILEQLEEQKKKLRQQTQQHTTSAPMTGLVFISARCCLIYC